MVVVDINLKNHFIKVEDCFTNERLVINGSLLALVPEIHVFRKKDFSYCNEEHIGKTKKMGNI